MLARQSTELLRLRSGAAAMAAAHASLRRLLFRTMPQAKPGQQGITRDTVMQLAAALSTQHDAVLRACGSSTSLKPPATVAAAQPLLVTLALAAPYSDSDSDPQAITTPALAPQPEATLVPKPSGSSGAAPKQKRPSVPTSPSTKTPPRIAAQTRTGLPVPAKKAAASAGSGAAGTTTTSTGTRVKGLGHQSAPGYQIIAAITRSGLGGSADGGAASKATVEGGAGMQEQSTA